MSLKNKKLMILGGNPETGYLVEYANSLGIHTIVVDPNIDSPAKKCANESYEVDGLDVNGIKNLARNIQPDGILVGTADILVPSYYQVCKDLDYPCYTSNKEQIEAFCTKDGFVSSCLNYGIGVIPNYEIDSIDSIDSQEIEFPVIVKPVDNGGGVGMKISWNLEELRRNVSHAITNSSRGRFLVEKFMSCDDMAAYYNFKDGEIFLSAISDRFTSSKQGNLSPVCIGALYPSKYTERFMDEVDPKLRKMFKGLDVKNGVLNIQFFVDEEGFYAYDPGFRLQGEAPHIHINAINHFDNREMLLNFALTGSMGSMNLRELNDCKFNNMKAATVWILLDEGIIADICGIDKIINDECTVDIIQRFNTGDQVTKDMLGNEKQVFARIYLNAISNSMLREKVIMIKESLVIKNNFGQNMILDFMKQDIIPH